MRRPLLQPYEAALVRSVLPEGTRAAMTSENFVYAVSAYNKQRQVQVVATQADYFAIKKFGITRS